MNSGPLLFVGILLSMAASWCGLVLAPYFQLSSQQPVNTAKGLYPVQREAFAAQGADVYRENGCAACHTRQVRGVDSDLRLFGARRSVALDFLYDAPVQTGSQRVGPDLANIGARQPDAAWQLLHLYNPRAVVAGSLMPRYPYLFVVRRVEGQGAPDALKLPSGFEVPAGHEVVPTPAATALVSYLQSQRTDVSLFEAPLAVSSKKEAASAAGGNTNAPTPATSK